MFGVDLGTTQATISYINTNGDPCAIPNARGDYIVPTAVYYPEIGEPIVGTDAIEQGAVDPQRLVRWFKLKLGTTEPLIAGTKITATDAAAEVIRVLKESAEQHLRVEVKEAVATCPANWHDDRKQALTEAYERNDIKVLLLLTEPSAAAIAHGASHGADRQKIAVFDFGGGTFDDSIVDIDGDQLNVLATEGVAELGGNDITNCLKQRVLTAIAKKCKSKPSPETDPLFHLDLDQRCETAKRSLSAQQRVPIIASYNGVQTVVEIDRDEFHQDIEPLVKQSLDALDRAVAAANLAFSEIDKLLMVGGTSRMTYIQQRVAEHTGLTPSVDVDPEKAIAYGAALACVAEMERAGRTATLNGRVIPSPDVFLRDVTAHGVGCCVVDRSGQRKCLVNNVIIVKNTSIPCQRADRFYLEHDGQTEAHIEILQGQSDADRDDCLLIGELELTKLPTETKRTQRICVEYVIDRNGMVTATATDTVSNRPAD